MRACIYVTGDLDVVALPHLSSKDVSVLEMDLMMGQRKRSIVIASIYLPGDPNAEPPPTQGMVRLMRYCEQRRRPVIIGCDSNAHHTVWGCPDVNIWGRTMLEFIMSTDLEIMNRGHEPTFIGRGFQSIIDLTLASQRVTQHITKWEVSREDSMSDHRYINFQIGMDPLPPTFRRNPRSTDWASYRRNLEGRIGGWSARIPDQESLEREATALQKAMLASYEDACPPKRVRMGRKVPWWNRELTELRKQSRKLLRRAILTRTQEDWEGYKDTHRQYKGAIQSSKRIAWRDFCGQIEGIKPSSRLYRVLSRDPNMQVGMLQLPNGEFTESREAALAHLLEVHFPGSTELEEEQRTAPPTPRRVRGSWELAKQMVTEERVRWAFGTFQPYKAAGPDGIFPALIQQGMNIIINPLVEISRASVALAYIPMTWRQVRVIFIAKPGKDSYSQAKSYRPISLTSFILKGTERLADRWIREGVLNRNPLHPCQHAYQMGKSVETALHNLVGRLETALEHREFALGAFFDIEGAFSNAAFESFEEALRERGVDRTLVKWISAMLRSRRVEAQMGQCHKAVTAKRGCPQGGVLSPLLWTLVMDDLLSGLTRQHIPGQAYADDGVLLVVGRFLDTVCNLMQRGLNMVQRWCEKEGLAVQPDKLELVLFTRRTNLEGYQAPTIYGRELVRTQRVKYLGVVLDSKLTWKDHMDTKCSRAKAAFCQVRRAVGKTWGLSPRVTSWLYSAIIRPMICFAAVVWWPRVELGIAKQHLGRVQRLACLSITGALHTTPTIAMEVLLAMPPLHIHIKMEAMATAYRLHLVSQWKKGSKGHRRIWQQLMETSNLYRFRSDFMLPYVLFLSEGV